MRTILIESGFERDIPKELYRYMERKNIVGWEFYDIRQKFWPENREETFKFFSSLPKESILIANHTFVDFVLLELFIILLDKLKDKIFTIKFQNPILCNHLLEFYEKEYSSITPKEIEELEDYNKEKEFKQEMNQKFIEVLQSHNIYWAQKYYDDAPLKTIEDIKNNVI